MPVAHHNLHLAGNMIAPDFCTLESGPHIVTQKKPSHRLAHMSQGCPGQIHIDECFGHVTFPPLQYMKQNQGFDGGRIDELVYFDIWNVIYTSRTVAIASSLTYRSQGDSPSLVALHLRSDSYEHPFTSGVYCPHAILYCGSDIQFPALSAFDAGCTENPSRCRYGFMI